jgi:hypothetical protein
MGIITTTQNQSPVKDTAMEPNHVCYWGYKRFYKRYMIIKCQVCGKEERRKIDRDKIPKGGP